MTKTPKKLDIQEVTTTFGQTYKFSKDWDKLKADAQKEFFAAATQEKAKERLPRKTVEYPLDEEDRTETDIQAWVETYHPGWKLLDSKAEVDEPLRLILEQDPALMKYVYVNPVDKMVYTRSISEPGPSLDTEHLQEEDPDLYEEISEWDPNMVDWTKRAMLFAHKALGGILAPDDEGGAMAMTEDFLKERDIPRQIKDPSLWTDAQSAAVQKYMVPGPIGLRLTPPRPANDEELKDLEDSE